MSKTAASHYDRDYFAWQNLAADITASLNKPLFQPFLATTDRTVVDFGCGSGALLAALNVTSRIGIEINPVAANAAMERGLTVLPDLTSLATASVDAVISNHALEHAESPFHVLIEMKRVLRPGGKLILVVPCDRVGYAYAPDDLDFHLFSWSAGNLGNLGRAAGFSVVGVEEIVYRNPPGWEQLYRWMPRAIFDLTCRAYGRVRRNRSQVRLHAIKPVAAGEL